MSGVGYGRRAAVRLSYSPRASSREPARERGRRRRGRRRSSGRPPPARAIARSVVPFGLVTRRRSSAGSDAGRREQLRRAEEGLLDHEPRLLVGEAQADRRLR